MCRVGFGGGGVRRGIDAALGEPEQTDDHEDRCADQQRLVPTTLVGDDGGRRNGGEHCTHADRSYGLG